MTLILALPAIVVSQSINMSEVVLSDTVKVVHPASDPVVFYESYDPYFVYQSGLFAGTMDLGAELTVINRYYDFFATLFVSNPYEMNRRLTDDGQNLHGGITFGKDYLLHETGDLEGGTRFYARVGPGVSMSRIVYNNTLKDQLVAGLHSVILVGATSKFSKIGTPYIEASFRSVWFPALDDVGMMGGFQISIGFQFSGRGEDIPVRFR